MTKKETLAYLAGIIDGEGSVFLGQRLKLRNREKSPSYTPSITVGNTNERLIDWLVETCVGSKSHSKRPLKNWKDQYQWSVTSHKAVELARMLMPYLIIKPQQAYLLSCFEHEAQWSKGGRPEDTLMPSTEINRRKQLYDELKILNRRGKNGKSHL